MVNWAQLILAVCRVLLVRKALMATLVPLVLLVRKGLTENLALKAR
jgi:hypothetical protein